MGHNTNSLRSAPVLPVNSPERSFILELAISLQRAGLPAHRLESRVWEVAQALNEAVAVFAAPTSVAIDFGDHTRTLAVVNGDEDLAHMVEVDAIAEAVTEGRLTAHSALEALAAARQREPQWSAPAVMAAFAVTSGAGAVHFGGGLDEVLVSALTGLAISLLSRMGPLFPVLASFTAALVGSLLPVSMEVVALSSCIVLLPGLTLTTGLTELANGHLVAGSARLARALTVLLQLGVGAALALALAPSVEVSPLALPIWSRQAAIVVGAASFVVLLQARRKDLLVILVASEAAVLGWEAGELLPPLGPALLGAVAVGLVANLQARLRGVPSAVAMVPGLLLLVPGSVGFRAVEAFSSSDAVTGMNAAFSCVQTAAALVSGLLLANALVKAR